MKVRLIESFRIRIMIYTCISIVIAVLCDVILFSLCIKMKWFVVDYDMESTFVSVYRAANDMNNIQSRMSTRGIIGDSDMFYRIFGVSVKPSLFAVMVVVGTLIFVCVFLLFTKSFTDYTDNVLRGARQMANGDFEHRIEVRHHDEVSCIADSFNRMADMVQMLHEKQLEAEQTKNDLITNVAHDLRTPLTSIIGYIDLVNTGKDLSEQQRFEYLGIAWEKSRKLEYMINELFSFTKIRYGKMPMNMVPIDLIKLLEQEVDELYPSFEENGLKCIFEPDVDACMVLAEGEQLVRVFDNLLGNAIRYGKDGKIVRVKTKLECRSIKVQVINYGSIISKENLPHLFEKFYKGDAARQSSNEGTGLGLAIAKSIIENHNGSISASSSFDGTIFEVKMPVKAEEEV